MKNRYLKISLKKILYIIASPILLLLSNLAWAQDAIRGQLPITSISPKATDLSIALLSKIFGTVTGSGLSGATSTIFGQMFNVFNSGILLVASIFLVYTTVRSVMELAQHSEASSRKFSWWQPMRIALGVGILVPQATGYSFLNAIVMWITLQGVGLADLVWNSAIDYISKGGTVYVVTPENQKKYGTAGLIDTSLISGSYGGKMGSVDILRSQTCMYTLNNEVNAYNKSKIEELKSDPTKQLSPDYNKLIASLAPVTFQPLYDEDNGLLSFPGKDYTTGGVTIRKGICGAYLWSMVPKIPDGKNPKQICAKANTNLQHDCDYISAKQSGLMQSVNEMDSISAHVANSAVNDKDKVVDVSDGSAAAQLVSAATNYQSIIYPMRISLISGRDINEPEAERLKAVYDDLKKYGWMSAGKSYFDLSKTRLPTVDYAYYYISTTDIPPSCTAAAGDVFCNEKYNAIANIIKKLGNTGNKDAEDFKTKLGWMTLAVNDTNYGALKLANDLNDATQEATSSDIQKLPPDLADFINKASFHVNIDPATSRYTSDVDFSAVAKWFSPSYKSVYDLSDIMFGHLNYGINSVACIWAQNFGIQAIALGSWPTFFQTPTLPNVCYTDTSLGPYVISEVSNISPFIRISALGNSMIIVTIKIWQNILMEIQHLAISYTWAGGAFATASAVAAPFSFASASLGIQELVNAAYSFTMLMIKMFVEIPMYMTMPIIFAITGLMFTTGVTLAYYIPLIPFMLFTFGVIGWISFVIEAMVATPIIALAITYPEGGQHELLGKAERALELLLSVFVRPTAMIFGLIAALVMSYIALDILNFGFGTIIGSLTFGMSDKNLTLQIRNGFMIIIYILIVMAIMNQCFSLVVMLPSKIMHWIGISHEGGQEIQALGEIKQGVTGAAEAGGRAAGGAIEGAKPQAAQKPEWINLKESKKGEDLSVTSGKP